MKNLTVDYGDHKITYSSKTNLIINKFVQLPENKDITTDSSFIRFLDWLFLEGYEFEFIERKKT